MITPEEIASARVSFDLLLGEVVNLRSDLTGCRRQLHDAEEREAVALAEVERLTAELSAAPKRAEAAEDHYAWLASLLRVAYINGEGLSDNQLAPLIEALDAHDEVTK